MASGWGYIPVVSVTGITGDFTEIIPFGWWSLGLVVGLNSGSLTLNFDPAGQYELLDDVGAPLGIIPFASLPAGFRIIKIYNNLECISPSDMNTNGQVAPWPSIIGSGVTFPETGGLTSWSTSFGWSQIDQTFTGAVATALASPFTFTGDYFIDTAVGNGMGPTNGDRTPAFPLNGTSAPVTCPPSVLLFAWDTLLGPPLGSITNPSLLNGNPNPTIQFTAPPGTTEVLVEVPGETPYTTPATPGINIIIIPFVIVTVISLTPQSPTNAPGPPINVPVDYSMTMAGGIDLGGAAGVLSIGDPSGIYTLVKDKTNDTLYERTPAVGSQVVQIPDPFIRTAFMGE